MSWVDIVIVVVVLLAALRGFSEGAISQIAVIIGLGAGFYLGTAIAPSLSHDFTTGHWRPALALIIILVVTLVGITVGGIVGRIISRFVSVLMLGIIDRVAGVAVGVVAALVLCWLLAGLLAGTPWASVDSAIQNSAILSGLDHVMPPVPSIESRVQTLFRKAGVPAIFANVIAPTLPSPVNPQTLPAVIHSISAPSDVVKVLASGSCNTLSEGTAFYVTTDEVVTNAHVVAGHQHFTVNGSPATVVLYDANNDIAVLRVAARGAPLRFLATEPTSDTKIQVVGFPLNGPRSRADGYLEGQLSGDGRNFYNQDLEERTFLALEVNVMPGNSGSPVLVNGRVAGVLESYSLSERSTAYAIPNSIVQEDIARTPTKGSASTESCLSGG
ncbi:MAG: CvpA family protein [Acidimicrobiales bacterium]